jgi:hypothetical protein
VKDLDEQFGTVRWFGQPWGAHLCVPETEVSLPAETVCSECTSLIEAGQSGVRVPHLGRRAAYSYFHIDCFRRVVLGDD